jgi:RNA polymerase sigma-70 factor (ECF subfamily)
MDTRDDNDPDLRVVINERRRLVNLAYRMLGSVSEAEDAVQETYSRWYAMTPEEQAAIITPAAWLTTVASRICLDVLGSARARRERYVGEWLPEPVPDTTEWAGGAPADPADRISLDESVSMAFLVVLESMTPAERVAFVLHDVFRYSFTEIADVVGRSPAACRQLATSARRRIRPAPVVPDPQGQAAVIRRFRTAWHAGDINGLLSVLDPDATVVADGGGVVSAALNPIVGADPIARFFVGLNRLTTADSVMLERSVNGQPGIVVQEAGATVTVFAFEVGDGRITKIWAMRNPQKLGSWPQG